MVAEAVAVVTFVGVIASAVFGGADYGAGIWDLAAGTGERGARIRRQIDRSIGPVWEANHVWLIFVIVMIWSAFPRVFATLMTTLAVPWSLVGLGIVFRGGAFVFRKSSPSFAQARLHGVVFAGASLATPFFLGTIAGAIAGGRVPLDGGDQWTSWTGPLSIVGGVLAVLVTVFAAGVLLTADAATADPADLHGGREITEWFRIRSLVVAVVTGAAAIAAAVTIELTADSLRDGLHGRAAPLIAASAIAGAVTIHGLRQRRYLQARIGAVAAVAAVVAGWGVAQYPDVLVDHATIDEVAGADATLTGLLIVAGVASITVLPALVWLLRLASRPSWN